MFNYLLLLVVLNPLGGEDAFIVDWDLSDVDCAVAMAAWDQAPENPNVYFVCEADVPNE